MDWLKIIIPLGLIAAIIFGLQSCTGRITGDLTRIAEINGPQAQAAGNTDKLMGEVKAKTEADRQAILAAGQAQLELERAKALQDQTLAQQAQEQEAQHQKTLGQIQADTSTTLAKIAAQAQTDLAAIEAQRVTTIAGAIVQVLIVVAGVVIAAIGMLTLRRVLTSFAVKREHAANVPVMLPYNKQTMTLPAFVAMVDNRPVLVDPNVGAILPLAKASKADLARARYIAAQNSIAVQAIHQAQPEAIRLPMLESEDQP